MRHKLKRLTIVQLERRYSSPVHDLTPDDFEIPAYVVAYLAKGGKFVPDTAQSTATTLFREVETFERSLNVAVHFDHCSTAVPRFQGSRCRLKSAWQPPKHTSVSAYCRLLRMELAQYSPCNRTKNTDFIDRAAQAWLRRHSSQVCVVDADKNLGDAIISRSWVTQESLRLTSRGSIRYQLLPIHVRDGGTQACIG